MNPGIFYAVAAGLMISLQNVFVTRTGEKVGFWEANTLIHGFGFLLALTILFSVGRSGTETILDVRKIYWVGLFIGVLIVFSVMQGVMQLGIGYAIPIMLTAQIIGSIVISRFGLFEEKLLIPSPVNLLGIAFLIGGVVLTQLK
jgi:transporter family-2 protein